MPAKCYGQKYISSGCPLVLVLGLGLVLVMGLGMVLGLGLGMVLGLSLVLSLRCQTIPVPPASGMPEKCYGQKYISSSCPLVLVLGLGLGLVMGLSMVLGLGLGMVLGLSLVLSLRCQTGSPPPLVGTAVPVSGA